ncbi:MAG: PAS domain-containing protein, partial [Rhodospirillaceae bacterium]|nr:PAS domain-containing protein [Rhodospirillaceae bacterium]
MAGFRFNVRRRNVKGRAKPTSGLGKAPPDSPSLPSPSGSDDSALVECIPCPALVVTADRRVAALNEPFCDAYGIKAAFFHVGEEFADFARRTSLAGSPGLIALGDMVAGDGAPKRTEIIAKNGSVFEARACPASDGKTLITLVSPGPTSTENTDGLFHNIIENMPGTVLSLARAADGRIRCLYASPQSAVLFGRGLTELTSPDTDFRTFIGEQHLADFDAALEYGLAKSEPFDIEFQITEPASGQRWVRCIGNASRGTDDTIIFNVRMLDIEDLRKVANERKRLEKLLDMVVDNIPASISVRDVRDHSYVVVNRAYEEITGQNRDDIIGRSDIRMFPELDNKKRDRKVRDMIERGRNTDLPEIRVKTPNKGFRLLKTKKCPLFDETDTVRYILAISEDVTEQRLAENALDQSQQRFRDAIESLTDGIALFDSEERLLLCNRRYQTMWPGFAAIALPGVTFELLVRHNLEAAAGQGKKIDIEAEVAARMSRYRNPPSTGEVPLFSGQWLQVTDRQTADGGVVVTCTDITALKEREAGLKRASQQALHAKEAAEGANRSKSDFLANM